MKTLSWAFLSLFIACVVIVSYSTAIADTNLAQADTSSLFTLDFEGLSDLSDVGERYAHLGLSFEGAVILTQGGSLNYLHFPPKSGINVIYDRTDGDGTITINLNSAVAGTVNRVGGYVTGNTNITMRAYNTGGQLLGEVQTGGANYDPVGIPNKQLDIVSTQHIARVVFSDSGNTFTVDDFYFEGTPTCNILDVPLYKQGSAVWGSDAYGGTSTNPWRYDDDEDHRFDEDPRDGKDNDGDGFIDEDTPETIAKWGCALTSAAMIVSYHGSLQNGFTTNPRELNNWLKEPQNRGYSSGHINWEAVARYARANSVELYYFEGRDPVDGVVNTYLCNGDPIVLGTNHSVYSNGHFLVATGGVDEGTWRVNDPGGGNFTELAKNAYNGIRRFSSDSQDPDSLSLFAHSPIELLIIDPAGRRTGYDPDTGEYLDEILDSSYDVEQIGARDETGSVLETLLFRTGAPISGEYKVLITGVDSGGYEIDFFASDSNDHSSNASLSAAIAPAVQLSLTLTYSTEVSSVLTVTLPPNEPPTTDAGGPYVATNASPLILDASGSSDPEGTPLVYRWDADGDGIWDTDWSTDPTFKFSYVAPGGYVALLEVSDGLAVTSATAEVHVTGLMFMPVIRRQ